MLRAECSRMAELLIDNRGVANEEVSALQAKNRLERGEYYRQRSVTSKIIHIGEVDSGNELGFTHAFAQISLRQNIFGKLKRGGKSQIFNVFPQWVEVKIRGGNRTGEDCPIPIDYKEVRLDEEYSVGESGDLTYSGCIVRSLSSDEKEKALERKLGGLEQMVGILQEIANHIGVEDGANNPNQSGRVTSE